MKIRLRDHAKFQADKMAKIALAATPRALLDLYCAGARPGAEAPLATTRRTRSTACSRAAAASASAAREETLEAGEAIVARGGRAARRRQRSGARAAGARARRRRRLRTRAVPCAPRAAFMVTCLGDMFFPEVGVAIVRLLRRPGRRGRLSRAAKPAAACRCSTPATTTRRRWSPRRTVELFAARRARGGAVGLLRVDGEARVPGAADTTRRRGAAAEAPGRAHAASCRSSSSRCWASADVRAARSRARSRTTTPATCCAACDESPSAARAAARACAGARARRAAGRGRVLRLRRLVLGAPARGVHRDPRQEAGQRRGDRRGAAWWPATPAASCRCGGGLSRRGSRGAGAAPGRGAGRRRASR